MGKRSSRNAITKWCCGKKNYILAHTQFLDMCRKPDIINLLVWAEVISKVNVDENVTRTSLTKKCAYEALKGNKPQMLPFLIQLGRFGLVTIHKSIKAMYRVWQETNCDGVC
jgi:hypothetical protein